MPPQKPEPYTPQMLEAVISALEGAAGRLEAVKNYLTESGTSELPINNSKELKSRGLPKVAAFAQAAEDAMRNHQLGG